MMGERDPQKLATVLSVVPIPKQLNRHCWNRQQEDDEDCSEVAHASNNKGRYWLERLRQTNRISYAL
jgi:hypothetical protein